MNAEELLKKALAEIDVRYEKCIKDNPGKDFKEILIKMKIDEIAEIKLRFKKMKKKGGDE